MKFPKLIPYVEVVKTAEGMVLYGQGTQLWEIDGSSLADLERLLPYLDGTRPIEEAAALAGISAPLATDICEYLRTQGILSDGPATPSELRDVMASPKLAGQVRYLSRFGDGVAAQAKLRAATVVVVGQGETARDIQSALGEIGVGNVISIAQVEDIGQSGVDLVVATDEGVGPTAFRKADEYLRDGAVPWLRVSIANSVLSVGPLFITSVTACYRCYELRFFSNAPVPDHILPLYRRQLSSAFIRSAESAAMAGTMVGSLVALAALKFLTRLIPCEFVSNEYTFDLYSLQSELHPLLRVPVCERCVTQRRPPHALVTPNPEAKGM